MVTTADRCDRDILWEEPNGCAGGILARPGKALASLDDSVGFGFDDEVDTVFNHHITPCLACGHRACPERPRKDDTLIAAGYVMYSGGRDEWAAGKRDYSSWQKTHDPCFRLWRWAISPGCVQCLYSTSACNHGTWVSPNVVAAAVHFGVKLHEPRLDHRQDDLDRAVGDFIMAAVREPKPPAGESPDHQLMTADQVDSWDALSVGDLCVLRKDRDWDASWDLDRALPYRCQHYSGNHHNVETGCSGTVWQVVCRGSIEMVPGCCHSPWQFRCYVCGDVHDIYTNWVHRPRAVTATELFKAMRARLGA